MCGVLVLLLLNSFFHKSSQTLAKPGPGLFDFERDTSTIAFQAFLCNQNRYVLHPLPHKHPNLKKKEAQTQPTFVTAEVHRCDVLNPAVF